MTPQRGDPPIITPDVMSQKWALATVLLCAALFAGVVGFLWKHDPVKHQVYPRCAFHQATGLNCPGCGGLRSVHHLSNGRVGTAFQNHPAFILTLPLWGWIIWEWAAEWRRTRRVPAIFTQRTSGRVLSIIVALFLTLGVLRNLPGPFQTLAPPPVPADAPTD